MMQIIGRYTVSHVYPDGRRELVVAKRNMLMVTHGFAACRLFGFGDRSYRINTVYIEFENGGGPDSPPVYDAFDGLEYYTNLTDPRDYLRVPITSVPTVSIVEGYEEFFEAGISGNRLRVEALTSGTEGENGLPFVNTEDSCVFGLALVAAPQQNDPSRDVIITRGYWDAAQRQLKPPTGQVHVSWELDFVESP